MQRIPVYRFTGTEKVVIGHALVDAERHWYASTSYASSHGELMHRLIMGAERGQVVHHRNGDRLDNRRENLEVLAGTGEHITRYHRRKPYRSRYSGPLGT